MLKYKKRWGFIMGILTMNKSILSNKFNESGLSKKKRKSVASEMYISTNCTEGAATLLYLAPTAMHKD